MDPSIKREHIEEMVGILERLDEPWATVLLLLLRLIESDVIGVDVTPDH